jgi:hypothetical protein
LILQRDVVLTFGWVALGAQVFAIALLLRTTPTDAIRVNRRASGWIILSATVALQLSAVWLLRPVLSQDWTRYRVDGWTWLSAMSPYVATPSDYYKRGSYDETDTLVPYWDLHTIYPPAAQAIFVAAAAAERFTMSRGPVPTYRFSGWRGLIGDRAIWGADVFVRLASAVAGAAATLALLSILMQRQISLWWSVLLAWNPLFIIETGGMGHVDIVGVLFVLLTVRALQSNRSILATAMLALAAGVKPHVVLLAPFLLRDAVTGGSSGRARWLAVSFISFLALVYSPMLYQQGYKGWLRTSRVYATSWEANGSIYDLIKASADPTDGVSIQRAKDRARLLAAGAVIVTMLIAWFGRADLVSAGYWIFLVALLFSPVVYPWYLLWVLCFVPLLRGWQGMTALVWAATVGVSYLLWRSSDWVLPTRWLLIEYLPVYATLLLEIVWLMRSRFDHTVGAGNVPIAGAS